MRSDITVVLETAARGARSASNIYDGAEGTSRGWRFFRESRQRAIEPEGADDCQQGADECQQGVGCDPLRDPGAERRGKNSSEQQASGCHGEGSPTQRGQKSRRDRDGQEELGGVDSTDGFARIAALDEEVRGYDCPPSAPARRVEESADESQRGDDLGTPFGMAVHDPAIEEIEAEAREIDKDDGLRRCGIDLGEHVGAENPADTPGIAMRKNRRQSTFPCAIWLMLETAVVQVSEACTPAEAEAGGTPRLISSVLEIWP